MISTTVLNLNIKNNYCKYKGVCKQYKNRKQYKKKKYKMYGDLLKKYWQHKKKTKEWTDGVIVSVPASSAVDCGFIPSLVKPNFSFKDNTIGIGYFSANHTPHTTKE